MRCLTLAGALCARSAEVTLFTNREALRCVPSLERAEGIELCIDEVRPDRAKQRFLEVFDAVVIDSYAMDAKAQSSFREVGRRVMAIDDLADRPHASDVLLNPNLGVTETAYAGLVRPDCRLLTGVKYALVRPEFVEARKEALHNRATRARARRALVSMGLTDVGDITRRVVDAVRCHAPRIALDVVLGSRSKSASYLEALEGVRLHVDPPSLARLMTEADLAVGAGGTTSWERCTVALPSVVLVVADNQRALSSALSAAGAARVAEDVEEVGKMVAELAERPEARKTMAQKAAQLSDGRGAERAAEAFIQDAEARP